MRPHALTRAGRRADGHTMLEMVFVVATMTIVLGGVMQIMRASRDTWQQTGSRSHLQESGRQLLETILADLRHSGLTTTGGSNYPAIWEHPRGTDKTARGALVATMNFTDETLVNDVLAYQGDGDHVLRNAKRVSDEIAFQLPKDLDHDGTPLDKNGELEWGPELVSYHVVNDAEGRAWLERDVTQAGAVVERRMVGPSVTSMTCDVVFNDRSLRYGVVDVILYLEEFDASNHRITVAVEGSVALRNTQDS